MFLAHDMKVFKSGWVAITWLGVALYMVNKLVMCQKHN